MNGLDTLRTYQILLPVRTGGSWQARFLNASPGEGGQVGWWGGGAERDKERERTSERGRASERERERERERDRARERAR